MDGIEDGSCRGDARRLAHALGAERAGRVVAVDDVDVDPRHVEGGRHDVVREMALWIASDLGAQKEAFIVRAGAGLSEMPKVENCNVVRRMSLIKNKIHHLPSSQEYLELTTLLLEKANLTNISSEFFKSMPRLAVLDLSYNGNLFELPDGISQLVSLQYLNLSYTSIRHLPRGVQELKKLIHLDLEETDNLSNIDGILSSLQNSNHSPMGKDI